MSDSTYPHDPNSVDFLWLIGRIVIEWSRVERAVDIALMSGRAFIPDHFKPGPPFSLPNKLKALRALCLKIPDLAERSSWIENCINDLLIVAEDRHTIIHGFFHGISGEDEPRIYFRRASPLSDEPGKRFLATRQELREFLWRLERLGQEFMTVMRTVISAVRKERNKA
jgi:hypothetical protein